MNRIFIITAIFVFGSTHAQIAVGKDTVDGNGILDFGNANNLGIILPIVDASPHNQAYADGTVLMDKNDLIVKVYQNGDWLALSDQGSLDIQLDPNGDPITTAAILNTSQESGKGVIIGGKIDQNGEVTADASGVLVLEAKDKALILPKVVAPHISIKSPVAGTICYDSESKSLAIFDGKVWNYWK